MSDPTPRFSPSAAERIARHLFGLTATASPLPSERDQNFALTTGAGKFVLKIAKADEEQAVLELQNAALEHVAQVAPELMISRLQPTVSGAAMATVPDEGGRLFFVRLATWVDGELLVNVAPYSAPLLASLGAALARLDAALASFRHPAMGRTLHWDLRHIDRALEHLPLLPAEQGRIIERFRPAWELVDWSRLRSGVIYNDANDRNVLVRDGRVAGFLDFGDMVHSARVCDLAIALAYVMLDQPDPLAAAATVANAFHRAFPLEPAELDALWPLALSRLCMSVCYAAHNARAKQGDAYQLVTAGPAWRLLQRLVEVPASTARERLEPESP
jgi:Ser/Thr protein kinase RdoA (MazF antagonist)